MEKYSNTILNKQGKPVAGALVTVTTYPGNAAATIYATDGGPAVQSVTSDDTGRFAFYAADGHYNLSITSNNIEPVTVTDVVLNDPGDESSLAALAAPAGAALVGFVPEGDGATPTSVQAQMRSQDTFLRHLSRYPRPVRSNTSALRWTGNAGGSVGALSDAVTYGFKIEAEAPFDAVALMWVNYETGAVGNCKAVVAPTETFQTDTQDRRYRPMVGGVAYNALRGTGSYGWDAVTWGGAATVNLPAAGGAAAPQAVVSDFMPINSVPRADGGTRPLLLVRAYHNGATDGAYSYESRNYNGSYNAASSANRGRLIDTCTFAGDAVGTLASSMLVNSKSFLIAPIFRYRYNAVTVANVGDSISMGTGSASGLDNWNRRACYDLSTPTAPVVPMNMGFASQTSTTYLGAAKVILAAAKPTIAFYFPYSPNDSISTNARRVQDAMARCAEFIDFCNTNRIIPILATPVPNNNLTAAEDALRKEIAANVRAIGSANAVMVADFTSVTGDGATPERWLAGLNSDTLHPSDAGHEAMSAVAKAAIVRAMAAY